MAAAKDTIEFNGSLSHRQRIREILRDVYSALETKGYDPVSQIVGYILSGDPTYITSYGNARYLISQVERDEILEEILKVYIRQEIERS